MGTPAPHFWLKFLFFSKRIRATPPYFGGRVATGLFIGYNFNDPLQKCRQLRRNLSKYVWGYSPFSTVQPKKDYFAGCTLSKGKTVHAIVVVGPAVTAEDVVKGIVRFFWDIMSKSLSYLETPITNVYLSPNTFQYFPCSLIKLSYFCVTGRANWRATNVLSVSKVKEQHW